MLQAALLWYKKFSSNLESIGYVFSPYNTCLTNKLIDSNQYTIRFHVDNIMKSHVATTVNDKFAEWLNSVCGDLGEVKQTGGKFCDYLGMHFDFSHRGQVRIHRKGYIKPLQGKPFSILRRQLLGHDIILFPVKD